MPKGITTNEPLELHLKSQLHMSRRAEEIRTVLILLTDAGQGTRIGTARGREHRDHVAFVEYVGDVGKNFEAQTAQREFFAHAHIERAGPRPSAAVALIEQSAARENVYATRPEK